MSAFIVEDEIINGFVSFVFRNNQAYGDKYYYALFALRDAGYLAGNPGYDPPLAAKRLAEEMFTLNCDAIEQRYGEGQAKEFRTLDFQYKPQIVEVFQVLKNISCWLYQCTEGDAPESALYRAVERVRDKIAWHLVQNMKQYEVCKW